MVVAPMAFQAAKQHSGLVGWLLVGVAIAPPTIFMLSPQVNRVSDVWLHEGIRITTPEVRAFGRTLVPSRTLFELEPLIKSAGEYVAFAPLAIAAPYFYDSTPPNSFDLVLIDKATNSEHGVAVPAPCPATVVSTGWQSGYGNTVDLQCQDGTGIFIAHFDEVWVSAGEALKKGQPFAVQGDTGRSFGKHLHVEIDLDGDDRPDPYSQSEPGMRRFMALWESGLAAPTEMPLDDETLMKAIGKAEGTVDGHLNPDADYHGHTDPGNGARNQGFFSFQHGASSPQDADQQQIHRLRNAEREIQAQAISKFGQPLSEAALLAALDLWNQAPLAGQDFVTHLPTHNPTPEQIIEARARSFIEPTTGQLDAPGLGNSIGTVEADQRRRTDANLDALKLLRRHSR
ncbi:MAG: M23 family metallopeptidase [Leptolyngbya sp. SIO1E4]|nr:M23 family metallopeptidase [Leptolyngbya sp. SIO1E4]